MTATDMNNIPPLQMSAADPIILGSNRSNHKGSDLYADFQLSEQEFSSCDEMPSPAGKGISCRRGNTKYIMDITEQSRRKKVCQMNEDNNGTHGKLVEPIFTKSQVKCTFRRVGTCFVMVKDSPYQDSNVTGSITTLPGEIETDEPEGFKVANKMGPINKFWNFSHQMGDLEKTEKFMKYARHCLLQIRKFINKLQLAISEEETYLEKVRTAVLSNKQMEMEECSPGFSPLDKLNGKFDFPSLQVKPLPTQVSPPRLGKVYAEFKNHFKVWDDIVQHWHDERMNLSHASFNLLPKFQRKIKFYHKEMLCLTQKLISARLRSLASCAVISTTSKNPDYDWSALLGAGCLKRFCKLIEVFNSALRKFCQHNRIDEQYSHEHRLTPSSFLEDMHLNGKGGQPQVQSTGALFEFTASKILSELSSPAKGAVGSCILRVLSSINRGSHESLGTNAVTNYETAKVDWGMLDDVEIDEDDIITQLMGRDVIHISDTDLSDETLSSVEQIMYAQGSFIVAFMNSLASNTSLMRNKLRSKSPRSATSSQHMTEEAASAISSEDDMSSIASSSFFSQLSGTGPTTSHHKRKTVLWRDSWDQEAVRSLSKSYMAMLVTEGPSCTLQLLLSHYVTVESVNSYAVTMKPRFGWDFGALMLDAFVSNMIELGLMPKDVLRSVQCSTQAFVINRALIHWDKKLCEALAIGRADKCGALPIRGSQPLTKTALTYLQAVHALLAVMKFHDREDVAQKALSRLESTLDSFYSWCYNKIQLYLTSWSLRPLLQVCLSDLGQLTSIGLTCLPLVEKCHNYVESRRTESPATLHHATKHLTNVDNIITNMQSLTGECMRMYSDKCNHLAKKSISATFPPHKLWRQKNLTDHSAPSPYMEESVRAVLVPVSSAVSVLNPRCQLTAVPPAVSALLDVTIRHIVDHKIRFSVQGALQLQRDFEYVTEFVCTSEANLCVGVVRAVPGLKAVKRAMWAVSVLQRTDAPETIASKTGYSARGRRTSRVSAFNAAEDDHHLQDEDSVLEKQLLALRVQGKSAKKWFTLPCADKAAD
uniref:Uncharacterized protein LOC100185144 n=1 Tax=Phallusia mammillata TaxID=59560 RepID=A0A6F9DJ28_9ASCI|nr:uncharacterized protein LOC100185144 [Phallusia mammillata]